MVGISDSVYAHLMKRCYILLGGIMSADGYLTSSGMFGLKSRLAQLDDVVTYHYTWANYRDCATEIAAHPTDKNIIIGYSGGAWKATVLAHEYPQLTIDMLIAYDASPAWNVLPLGPNVKAAVCYFNAHPMMWWPGVGKIGGGKLVADKGGPKVLTVIVREQHLAVQFDGNLHRMTVETIKNMEG